YSVTLDATGFAEEKERALLLRGCQRAFHAASELVNRGIGTGDRELKLGDDGSEHVEVDRSSGGHFGEELAEECLVRRAGVQAPRDLGANRVVVPREVKSGHFRAFRWRNKGLCRQ